MKAYFIVANIFLLLRSCHGWWLRPKLGNGPRVAPWRNGPLWAVSDFEDDAFFQAYHELGFSKQEEIHQALKKKGLWNDGSQFLQTICHDYFTIQQPNQLSRMLQEDFGLEAIQAHMVRSTLWQLYLRYENAAEQSTTTPGTKSTAENTSVRLPQPLPQSTWPSSEPLSTMTFSSNVTRPLYKQVSVRVVQTNRSVYGLSSMAEDEHTALLRQEMDLFWHEFMTRPNPYHPTATPLRNATAQVYVRHANLFLGWYLNKINADENATSTSTPISLRTIFRDDSVESASILLDFVRWLREDREISSSYEANVWRGLTKLLQFRHSQLEGQTAASLENIPALLQIRKWHREAENTAKKAPRRSQEDRKWLSWGDYLRVVKQCKLEFLDLEREYQKHTQQNQDSTLLTSQERKVATSLQRYLVLAIFATVPDRQRTIRELEINQSLVKDPPTGMWCIKHQPKDYKTGKTYGERPKLLLHGLTADIDLFIEQWRPKLQPLTNFLFVQQRTSKPLTQDSVYQMVSRACYQFTGQRTNPHLLRDMIVTHVRQSTTTSEAELEALAMLMGHSVAVQRASYDRRTLAQKVAPAVDLMQKVNGQSQIGGGIFE